MKGKRLFKSALCSALALTLLVGCSSTDSGSTDGAAEVVVNLGSEPSSMNTVLATGSIDGNVMRHIMVGLVSLDENDEPIPGVAKDWDISEDKLTYTFNLRDDMTWTNGEPVTANDFVYAMDTLFTPAYGAKYAGTWAPLIQGAEDVLNSTTDEELATALENVGYKAIDDYTLEIKITGPHDYFLGVLAFMNFYPLNEKAVADAGASDPLDFAKYATEADNIVTNGPFIMESWSHESEIVLVKDENYYAADDIKLDKITMKMITDTNTALNEYNAGSMDLIGLTADQKQQLEADGVETLAYDDGSTWYLEYNVNNPGLNNKKVRQALTIGADAATLVEQIIKNDSSIATSYTPAAIQNGEFQAAVGELLDTSRDFEAAKALLEEGLAEEGIAVEDFELTILGDEGDSAKRYYEFIQASLQDNLGITVSIEQVTYQTRLDRMSKQDFDLVYAGWGPDYNDAMTFMDLWVTTSGNNHAGWSNAEYDQLIADARAESNADARTALLIEAEELLAEESPIGTLYWRQRDYVTSDRLEGVVRTAFQDLDLTGAYIK